MNQQALKEELVDLRMKLAEAETQANTVVGLLPTKWGLGERFRQFIRCADQELCRIAREMELDKIDLVEPRRVN